LKIRVITNKEARLQKGVQSKKGPHYQKLREYSMVLEQSLRQKKRQLKNRMKAK
jgi:hypothetical protein